MYNKIINIQQKLKAPKTQRNNFGNYNYRSCEDILEAVKPLLEENKCTVHCLDDTFADGIDKSEFVEILSEIDK